VTGNSKSDPVFEEILGILDGREWELISVQHAVNYYGGLYSHSVKAYLKRPVVDGRPTDQPSIPPKLWK
jgi:hypothetical protein